MNELHIPRITPVRAKTELIRPELIDPSSSGNYFPPQVGPRVVYLDPRYIYADQLTFDDAEQEKERQASIWKQVDDDGASCFVDREVEAEAFVELRRIKDEVYGRLGARNTAQFYERVFSIHFGETINIVIISTGVNSSDSDNYHNIGYLEQ